MENKCANCSADFKGTVRKHQYLVIPESSLKPPSILISKDGSSHSSSTLGGGSSVSLLSSGPNSVVSALDALKSVFIVPSDASTTSDDHPVINVCPRCCSLLEQAYRLVMDLSQVRATDSFFARKIKERDDLIKKGLTNKKDKKSRRRNSSSSGASPKRKHSKNRENVEDGGGGDADIGEDFVIDGISMEFLCLDYNSSSGNVSITGSPGKEPNAGKKGKSRRSRSLGGDHSTIFKRRSNSSGTPVATSGKSSKSSGSVSAKKAQDQSPPAQAEVTSKKRQRTKKVVIQKPTLNTTTTPVPQESQLQAQEPKSSFSSFPITTSGRPSRTSKLNAYAFMNVSAENESSAKQMLSKKNQANASASSGSPVLGNNIVPTATTNSNKDEADTSKNRKSKSKKGKPIKQKPASKAPVRARNQSRNRLSSEAILTIPDPVVPSAAATASAAKLETPSNTSNSKSKHKARQTKAKVKLGISPAAAPTLDVPLFSESGPGSTPGKEKSSKGKKGRSKIAVQSATSPENSLISVFPSTSRGSMNKKGVRVLAFTKPKVVANPRGGAKGKGKHNVLDAISVNENMTNENQAGTTGPLSLTSTNTVPSKKGKGSKKTKPAADVAILSSSNNTGLNSSLMGGVVANQSLSGSTGKGKSGSKGQVKAGGPGAGLPPGGVLKARVVKAKAAKITLPKKSKVPKVKVADASTSASPSGFAQNQPSSSSSNATSNTIGKGNNKSKIKITEIETHTERPSAALLIQQREEALDLTFTALQNKQALALGAEKKNSSSISIPSGVGPTLSSGSNSILVASSGSGTAAGNKRNNHNNSSSIVETPKRSSKSKNVKSVKFAETVSKLEIPARDSPPIEETKVPKTKNGGGRAAATKNKKLTEKAADTEDLMPTKPIPRGGKKNAKQEKQSSTLLFQPPRPPLPAPSSSSTEVLAVKSNPVLATSSSSSTVKYQCPDCDYEAPARFNLQRHQIGVHELKDSTGPPFTCSACNVTFGKKAKFVIHRMGKTCGLNNGPNLTAATATTTTTTQDKGKKDRVTSSVKDDTEKTSSEKATTKKKKRSRTDETEHQDSKKDKKDDNIVLGGGDPEPKAKKPKLVKKEKAKPVQQIMKVEETKIGKPKLNRKRKIEINGTGPVVMTKEGNLPKTARPTLASSSSLVGVVSTSNSNSTEPLKVELKADTKIPVSLRNPKAESETVNSTVPAPIPVPSSSGPSASSIKLEPSTSNQNRNRNIPVIGLLESSTVVASSLSLSSASSVPALDVSSGLSNVNTTATSSSDENTTTTMSSESDETISTSKDEYNLIIDEDGALEIVTDPATVTPTLPIISNSNKGVKDSTVNSSLSSPAAAAVGSQGEDKEVKVVTLTSSGVEAGGAASTTTDKNLVTMTADSTTGSSSGSGGGGSGTGVGSSSDTTTGNGTGTVGTGGGAGAGSGTAVGVGIGA